MTSTFFKTTQHMKYRMKPVSATVGTETESPHKITMTEWNLEHQDQK